MTPRSKRTRFAYFVIFFLVFLVALPFVIFYSLGYDFGKNFSIFKTGGVYVYAPETGAKVYIDNSLDDTTSIFQHGILIKSLHPKTYEIQVSKDGYATWKKQITVKEENVSEAYPFLAPSNVFATSVPAQIKKNVGTTTALTTNPDYTNLLALFAPKKTLLTSATVASSTILSATPTLPQITSKKVVVEKDGDVLKAIWTGNNNDTPFYFCLSGTICVKDFTFYNAKNIGTFDFYPSRNDVVLVVSGNKIFITELDMRTPQNTATIFESKTSDKIDFRIIDNENIVVKVGKELTRVSLVYANQ